jgi:hypothetical protein
MIALAVAGLAGYALSSPSEHQLEEARKQERQAQLHSLAPLHPITGQLNTAGTSLTSDIAPDFSNRGGYGDDPPLYLNSNFELGTAITKGHKQTAYQEAPRPGTFLGMNDTYLGDDIRNRTMMEASAIQTDMNNFNGEGGWAQGMTLVSKPNPQQAQIDARRTPVTSLSKPFTNLTIGPDSRRPNPTSVMGISYNTSQRDVGEVVRLPERAIPFENQMGQATAGGSGNANLRPDILNGNPYAYTRQPKAVCHEVVDYLPNGQMPFWSDTQRTFEGEMVKKNDSMLGRAGGKAAHMGNAIVQDVISKDPLTAEVEARVPGGTYAANPNQCDRIDISMEGQHLAPVPVGKDVVRREVGVQAAMNYAPQGVVPAPILNKWPEELVVDQQVGGTTGLELEAGTQLSNPFWVKPDFVSRN